MELTATKYKQTEVGLIPEDWNCVKIGSITNASAGGTPNTKIKEYWGGTIPWMNSGELNLKHVHDVDNRITEEGLSNSSTKYIPVYSVLIGLAGQGKTRGTAALNHLKLCTNQSIAAIYPSKKHDPFYLYYYLDSLYTELRKLSTGDGGRGGLNLHIIKNILVPLPPLTEQKAIAQVLSDTDALIQALEKKIAKKKLIKKGVMQKLLTPKADWQVKTIKEIANYRRGSFPQPYGLPQWYDDISGMPFIQVVDVEKNFKLKRETKQKISKAGAEMSVFVKKGTVILTIQGSIGRICITDYDAYVDRTLLIFESLKEDFDMYFFMLSIWLKFQTEKQNAPGGIIKTITKEALSSFEIAYPKKEEQSQIAQMLLDMEKEIENIEKKLAKYQLAKQGMMQQLLTGKIRIL